MSCDVQTFSRSVSNANCATAARDFAMNGTSTSAPGLVTSSRQHSTANCWPTSRRRRDNPRRLETLQARGRLGRRARRTRCRRTRGEPARHPDQHHRQPGRLLDGDDHRGRLPQPAAHRRPRLRPAVGVHVLLDTLFARPGIGPPGYRPAANRAHARRSGVARGTSAAFGKRVDGRAPRLGSGHDARCGGGDRNHAGAAVCSRVIAGNPARRPPPGAP